MKLLTKENMMKTIAAIIVIVFNLNTVLAQDNLETTPDKERKISGTIELSFGDKKKDAECHENDTTIIRMGKKEIIIIETGKNKHVDIKRSEWEDDDWDKDFFKKFDGHWASFDIGVNGFVDEDYSRYGGTSFMDLNQSKSLEVNINFLEYNIGFQKDKKNIGMVTGMGLSYNNYRFDNPYTIKKVNGIIEPIPLGDEVEKSKLAVTYLTVPLLLEFQIPVNDHSNKLFIAGGVVGGLNIGSHTKIKWDGKKEKERGGFNLNPFKYEAICKVGLNDISLYATYSLSPLFRDNKGPGLTPFTIGISFINF